MPPAPTWLTVEDRRDGTGVTANVVGGGPGQKLQASVVHADHYGDWYDVASYGDGIIEEDDSETFNIDIAPGMYRWNWILGTAVPIVTEPATLHGDSVHDRCCTALVDRIKALNLPKIGNNVYNLTTPNDTNKVFPCVMVTVAGEAESYEGGLSNHDDLKYPCVVAAVDRNDAEHYSRRDLVLHWRYRMMRAIRHQRWDLRLPEVLDFDIDPDVVVRVEAPIELYLTSGFVVRCLSRETRGV